MTNAKTIAEALYNATVGTTLHRRPYASEEDDRLIIGLDFEAMTLVELLDKLAEIIAPHLLDAEKLAEKVEALERSAPTGYDCSDLYYNDGIQDAAAVIRKFKESEDKDV